MPELTEGPERPEGAWLGVTVWDLFYVALTIVIFAVLIALVKGVERFER